MNGKIVEIDKFDDDHYELREYDENGTPKAIENQSLKNLISYLNDLQTSTNNRTASLSNSLVVFVSSGSCPIGL